MFAETHVPLVVLPVEFTETLGTAGSAGPQPPMPK